MAFKFDLTLYLFCVFGALLLWMKSSMNSKKFNGLSDVFEKITDRDGAIYVMQFLFFIFVGGLAGFVVVSPITQTHALAAGMAWSRLAARD
ncbi:MAG: hypothetical protein BGO58_04305 [Sphingopyxis sp. 65-8]|nr:MAG: hypothetical protein BGO58_04305 [Sphingopyxis sp. 65-8]